MARELWKALDSRRISAMSQGGSRSVRAMARKTIVKEEKSRIKLIRTFPLGLHVTK